MQSENIGEYIRQLREKESMPLRKLAAILDIDQSTLSKLERGERPVTRKILPIIAKTFGISEKDLIVNFLSKQIAYQLFDEEYARDILRAAEKDVNYFNKLKEKNEEKK